ncbi:DUF5719 family protein [Cellulomonas sp.]|uniref:DUF5719 family protein n=1 Tax=Cellulomonas sp. TaxID=40001 RepID=UPI00258932EC|nr:DUF5719 family protein [Cellulomonas sp.]MCR6690510.1 DUF5719 family protein [Cellulomonas sp.]
MSGRDRAVRIASGVLVLGVAAGAVAAGTRLPSSATGERVDAGVVVDVPPSPARLVCPGPLVLPEGGAGDDQFDPVPVPPVTSLVVAAPSSDGGAVTAFDGSTVAPLAAGQDATTLDRVRRPLVVQADPTDVPAQVAAAASALVTRGDLRGLAAASCQVPTTDAWLVGGSTELGATALLVLQNAGATPAVVHLDVLGPTGRVDLDTEQYLVAPGEERVVVLGGLAPQERRVAVHVTATGGRVAAHVQDSTLEGFTPTGTDLVVPGAAPARRQVVPAVPLRATEVDDASAGVLRLVATGAQTTTARVRVLGPDGVQDLPGAEALELDPGAVTDVPLGGLAEGSYTFVVDADRAVVAAAMVARSGDPTAQEPTVPTQERAWVPSVSTDGGFVALPAGTTGAVVLGAVATGGELDARGTVGATLQVVGADGRTAARRHVELEVGRSARWQVADLVPAGAAVLGVRVVPDDATSADAWLATGLLAAVAQADGPLLSVLVPAQEAAATSAALVRQDPRTGTR